MAWELGEAQVCIKITCAIPVLLWVDLPDLCWSEAFILDLFLLWLVSKEELNLMSAECAHSEEEFMKLFKKAFGVETQSCTDSYEFSYKFEDDVSRSRLGWSRYLPSDLLTVCSSCRRYVFYFMNLHQCQWMLHVISTFHHADQSWLRHFEKSSWWPAHWSSPDLVQRSLCFDWKQEKRVFEVGIRE